MTIDDKWIWYLIGIVAMVRLYRKAIDMKDIFNLPIGSDGKLEGSMDDAGQAHLKASYSKDGVSVVIEVSGNPKPALDHLKEVVPGKIDDMVIDALESYLGLK